MFLIATDMRLYTASDVRCSKCGQRMSRAQTLAPDYRSSSKVWRVVRDEYECMACRELKVTLNRRGD